MDLLREVEAYIDRHQLIEPGERIVVGVSGGADSVALLHILRRLAPSRELDLHVAHLNHSIRGAAAEEDMTFVANLAKALQLPCTIETLDVPKLSRCMKLTIEEAARRARYGFLCQVAERESARYVAVAHHADDQAETVLMHLLRGAGPAGLRGMLPSTPLRDYRLLPASVKAPPGLELLRPLLGVSRADIEAYCQQYELETRFDTSNLDTTYFRNQLRHEVIPYLANISPKISERLWNLAEIVRADYKLLEEFVAVARDTLLQEAHADALVFDLARWREQPLAIQRAVVRQSAYELRRSLRDVDFDHVEHAVDIAQKGETGAQALLPRGLTVTVGYTSLMIADADALHLPSERPWLTPGTEIPVAVPGVTPLQNGWALHAREVTHWNYETIVRNPNPLAAWMDSDAFEASPILRTRREGDRFHPQGMPSEMRLSDFLINVKLPRRWRDHLPLLEADGEILWVSGVRLSEEALVDRETESVVYLRFHGPSADD
ncbi:MAG: tRNA lysidine(34) synthetase TilS [Anaerolineae bacterium]